MVRNCSAPFTDVQRKDFIDMDAKITAWHEQDLCTWCEKERECVTVDFGDGFIRQAPLCWGCLQNAVKVRSKQDAPENQGPKKIVS